MKKGQNRMSTLSSRVLLGIYCNPVASPLKGQGELIWSVQTLNSIFPVMPSNTVCKQKKKEKKKKRFTTGFDSSYVFFYKYKHLHCL